jgi:hypothetical protein
VDTKSIFKSLTALGGLISVVPAILGLFGVTVTGAEVQTAADQAGAVYAGIIGLVGFVTVIVGRFRAKTAVTVTGAPKAPSQ